MATQETALVKKYESVKEFFARESVRNQLQGIVPAHVNADKLLRVAFSVIKDNPTLLQCSLRSLVGAIIAGLQLGLSFERALGQAYPVPFKGEVQLIIGYRGYITLARNSGELSYVSAEAVFDKDFFEFMKGTEERIVHKPCLGERGKFLGAYCVFHYKDGSTSFDVMGKEAIDKIRARSKAGQSGPWNTDYDEMAIKTVIRHHAKLVPLSTELAKAMELDERHAMGDSQIDLLPEMEEGAVIDVGGKTEDPALTSGTSSEPSTTPTIVDIDFEKMISQYCELEKIEADTSFQKILRSFLVEVAKSNNSNPQTVKSEALKKFPDFWEGFKGWAAKQGGAPEKKTAPKKSATPSPEPPKQSDDPPPPPEPPETLFGNKAGEKGKR